MSGTAAQKTWAFVGKISVIVGIVGTLFGIYVRTRQPEVELTAVSSYHQYAMPPDLDNALDAVRKATSLDKLSALLEKEGAKDPKCAFDAFDLARAVAAAFEQAWPEQYRYRADLYSGFWYFQVRNLGDLPATEVVLDVPVKGVALLTPESGDQRLVNCEGFLSIGTLRPGNSVSVALWSSSAASSYMERDVRLTHSSGVGSVAYERTLVGWRAWVGENLGMLLMMFLLVALVIGMIVAMALEGASKGPTDKGVTKEAEGDSGGPLTTG